MNLEEAQKVHKALASAFAYANENPNDPKQRYPFCNPSLVEQLNDAINVIRPIMEDLGYEGNMYGMYDAGAMYSDEFTDHNPT